METVSSNSLSKYFTVEEIKSLKSMVVKGRSHPLSSILFTDEKRAKQTTANTEIALQHILRFNPDWFKQIKHRLFKSDFSDAASALSEIRAYGYLLQTGLSVETVPKKSFQTQDFLIKSNDGEGVRVEVIAKQYDDEVTKDLKIFRNEIEKDAEKLHREKTPAFISRISDPVSPFGKPKKGEKVAENVISRLASIKQCEKQLSKETTSLLWLDFQDDIWWVFNVDSVLPIRSWNSGFYSGEIWYAFYGFKDAPIFEVSYVELIKIGCFNKMQHEGRFRQKTKVDAVIITFPNHTVMLENPWSKKPIKSWLTEKLIKLPWFSYEYSYMKWPNFDLSQHIELQKQLILSLATLHDDNENR